MSRTDVRARRTRTTLALALVPLAVAAAAISSAVPAAAADPTVTAVEPTNGPVEGGGVVTFHGTGFIPDHTLILWDGVQLVPSAVTVTTVEVIAPPGDEGAVDVLVLVAEGTSPVLTYVYGEPPSTEPEPEPAPTRTERAPAAVPSSEPPRDEPVAPRRGRPADRSVPDAVPDTVPDEPTPTRLAETGGAPGALVPATVLVVLGTVLVGGAVRLRD